MAARDSVRRARTSHSRHQGEPVCAVVVGHRKLINPFLDRRCSMLGPRTILLLEPHVDSREMYRHWFECSRFRVLALGSEADAVNLAAGVDVIVTEIRVDGVVNNVEMIRRFRERYPSAAIIVVTTTPLPAVRARTEEAGADVVLVKPCFPEALTDAIERALTIRCVV